MFTEEPLGGSTRSNVRRVHVGGSVIVKEFTAAGEGWTREGAALSVLPAGAPAPRLVTAAGNVVVMEDLGAGPSVADALLGRDPAEAETALTAWAEALADLHRLTADRSDAFATAVAPLAPDTVATELNEAAATLARHCADLGVTVPPGALDELRALNPGGPSALTPADACPDNNVRTPDGRLFLIDFEAAEWRPVAWDLAYLSVPWPSCWCAWQVPADVLARAAAAYHRRPGLPCADADVAVATTGWAFITTGWFLPRALADDPPMTPPARPAPSRRALVLHRLAQARTTAATPALAGLADRLHAALTARWGAVPLPYAPAFRAH